MSEEERVIYKEAAEKILDLKLKGNKPETPEGRRQEIAERNVG